MQQVQNKSSFVGIVVVAGIVLFIAMAVAGPGSRFGNAWSYLTSGNGASQSQAPAQGDSVVGGPSISAQKIDAILSSAGSPAAGSGQVFYNDSLTYGVDDSVALAFFHHESGYGTQGAATQTMNMGNIRCTDGYSCIGGFRAYPSWQAGINDWYQLIKNEYVNKGATTVESIIPIYAPASDNNSPTTYIAAVQSDVNAWRQS